MSRKLTRFLRANIVLILLSGCMNTSQFTPFPVEPILATYTNGPVISCDEEICIVVDEMVENSMKEHIFIKAVLKWKDKNGIK